MARRLRVKPQQTVATNRQRPLETPLLLVGLRRITRYIVLPFVLPLLGTAAGAALGIVTGAALGILVVLDMVAIIAIVATLRWLWQHQHPILVGALAGAYPAARAARMSPTAALATV